MAEHKLFTPEELDAIDAKFASDDARKLPLYIVGVSQTQLSISRFHGGCWLNGAYYVYHPLCDSLVREDVFRFISKMRTLAFRSERRKAKAAQQQADLL